MAFSNYLGNKVIDFIRGTAMGTAPAAIYLSLHTADPGATGASELPATGAYVRVNVTGQLAAASGKATTNTVEVVFPEATSAWAAATHACLWDAASAGNPLMSGALTASKTAGVGVSIRFPVGDLDLNVI